MHTQPAAARAATFRTLTRTIVACHSAEPFFFNNPCNDASPAERATVFSQGIIGIGPQAIAADNTDSFMMKLLSSSGDPTLERSFAIRMCEDGGDLWIGGSDASTYVAAPLYTPLSGPFFGVTPTAALLDGKAVPGATFPAPSPNYISAVDSGTTYWTLPPAVHDGIISSLNANAAFSKFFSAGFWTDDSGRCLTPKADPTTGAVPTLAQMQAEMPTLTITFASGLSVTMDGIGSYIMPCSKRYNSFTPGIFSDGGSDGQFELSIWGWAFMNQFIVHHDLANNRLGFSVRKGCSSGNPSNRAAVYAGSAPPASGTGSGTGTGSSSSTGGSDVCVPTPGVICPAEKLAGSRIIAAFLMIIAIVQQRLL